MTACGRGRRNSAHLSNIRVDPDFDRDRLVEFVASMWPVKEGE